MCFDFSHVPIGFPKPFIRLLSNEVTFEPVITNLKSSSINEALLGFSNGHLKQLKSWNIAEFLAKEIFESVNYRFDNCDLILEACTHCSVYNRANNQRLEFFGDSILDFAVLSLLFNSQPWATPGELSTQKSDAINNWNLGCLALKIRLHKCLITNSESLQNEFEAIELQMQKILPNQAHLGHISIDVCRSILQGRQAAMNALADAFEAFIAAVFIDSRNNVNTIYDIIRRIDMLPQLQNY